MPKSVRHTNNLRNENIHGHLEMHAAPGPVEIHNVNYDELTIFHPLPPGKPGLFNFNDSKFKGYTFHSVRQVVIFGKNILFDGDIINGPEVPADLFLSEGATVTGSFKNWNRVVRIPSSESVSCHPETNRHLSRVQSSASCRPSIN